MGQVYVQGPEVNGTQDFLPLYPEIMLEVMTVPALSEICDQIQI
jgi:hypothetical protein